MENGNFRIIIEDLSFQAECSKLIIQSGIKRVVYAREYRITDGLDLLKRAGVEIVKLNYQEK